MLALLTKIILPNNFLAPCYTVKTDRNCRECLKGSKFTPLAERKHAHMREGPSKMQLLRKPRANAVGSPAALHSAAALASELRVQRGRCSLPLSNLWTSECPSHLQAVPRI